MSYRLLISCPDTQGLVAVVSQFIANFNGNIIEAHHYLDKSENYFFMRNEIEKLSLNVTITEFKLKFQRLAKTYKMSWSVIDSAQLKDILIMGSQATHCVADLLHRLEDGDLQANVIGILSNHKKLAKLANWYKVPFKHIAVNNKEVDLKKINTAIDKFNANLIVLARYMQIIPIDICNKYENKIINIHHSFLPSFKGGNPYKQAKNKGVKLIGATCHYINENLDDGAIIEQEVARVNHNHNEDDMRKIGQDIEKTTLAKGVKLHLEDRIIVFKNKTIIFN